jgi:hypothetical protein
MGYFWIWLRICGVNRQSWLVNDTAVQIWHRCDFGPHIRVDLATFKGNIYRKNIHRQFDLHIYNFHTQNMRINQGFHSRFSPRIRNHTRWKKTRGRKSLVSVPLRYAYHISIYLWKNIHSKLSYTISIVTFTHKNMGVNKWTFFVTVLTLLLSKLAIL